MGTTQSNEPTEITQGTTYAWIKGAADYSPADGWALTYQFRGQKSSLTITGTTNGAEWTCTITAAASAAIEPGLYAWQASASKGAERYLVDEGITTVKADFGATHAVPVEPRSTARQMYEMLNGQLLNAAYVKTLQPEQLTEMIRTRKQLEWDCKREDDAEKLRRGGYPTRKIFTRFIG